MAVYFIRAGNFIKIGYAADPKRRVKELQTGNPHRLELVGSVDGDMNTEASIHRMFADFRVNGEWFELTTDIMAYAQGKRHKESVAQKVLSVIHPKRAAPQKRSAAGNGWIEFNKKGTRNPKYYAKQRNWYQDETGAWKKTTGVRVKDIPPMTEKELALWKKANK